MKVKVIFFSSMRQITGLEETEVELPEGATVANLFKELSNRFGEPIGKYFYDEETGARAPAFFFLQDYKNQLFSFKKSLDTKLKGGEKFAIMPPAGGG